MTEMFLKDKNEFEKDVKDNKIMLQICYQMPSPWFRISSVLGPMTWRSISLDVVGELPENPLLSVRTWSLDAAKKNRGLTQGANLDGGKRSVQQGKKKGDK